MNAEKPNSVSQATIRVFVSTLLATLILACNTVETSTLPSASDNEEARESSSPSLLIDCLNLTPNANLQGCDLSGSDHGGGYCENGCLDVSGADLRKADLSGSNFMGASLERANLEGAKLVDALFPNCNLRDAKLRNADMSRVILDESNLAGADLRGANLSGASLFGANLAGARLAGANLDGARLTGATMPDGSIHP